MKIRSDFVSNSSSCSFTFNVTDSMFELLKQHKKLLSNLHTIYFEWNVHDCAKTAYQYMMQTECIRLAQERNDYSLIEYGDDSNVIAVHPMIFNMNGCCDAIFDIASGRDTIVSHRCDTIRFYIYDTWDSRSTRLIQLLTLLDINGYYHIKDDGYSEIDYISLKDLEDDNTI